VRTFGQIANLLVFAVAWVILWAIAKPAVASCVAIKVSIDGDVPVGVVEVAPVVAAFSVGARYVKVTERPKL